MPEIFVEIRGGVLQEIYTDSSDVRVCFLDWDAGDRPGDSCVGGHFTTVPSAAMPKDTGTAFTFLMAEEEREARQLPLI